MISEVDKGKQASIIAWAAIYGEAERSELVTMDRDFESKKHGHSATLYITTLKTGLYQLYKTTTETLSLCKTMLLSIQHIKRFSGSIVIVSN